MSEQWHSISNVQPFARTKLVRMIRDGLLKSRARKYLEDRYSEDTLAQIAAAHLRAYDARGRLEPTMTDEDLEQFIACAPVTRIEHADHPIDPSTWYLIESDQTIWHDASWVHKQSDGKFGIYLVGIEFQFGDFEILREAWLKEVEAAPMLKGSKRPEPVIGRPRRPQYAVADAPLLDEMRKLISSGEASSPNGAAAMVAHRAKGGTDESKARRLARAFRAAPTNGV
jgi:hypothetical protein